MSTENISPVVTDNLEWLPLLLPGSDGIYVKVLRVEENIGRVVAKVKFSQNSSVPRHYHFCQAVAYTISGSWEYDEGKFNVGDVAVEPVGNLHQATSTEGTEMLLVFDTDSIHGHLLDNYYPDGSVIRIGVSLFKQLEGKSMADIATFDPTPYIEFFSSYSAAEDSH